jgi:hypothetical protein
VPPPSGTPSLPGAPKVGLGGGLSARPSGDQRTRAALLDYLLGR